MTRSISEVAAMTFRLAAQADPVLRAVTHHVALGQAILVASEAATGLPRLCVLSSVGANAD
jgi:hypothetical protein